MELKVNDYIKVSKNDKILQCKTKEFIIGYKKEHKSIVGKYTDIEFAKLAIEEGLATRIGNLEELKEKLKKLEYELDNLIINDEEDIEYEEELQYEIALLEKNIGGFENEY